MSNEANKKVVETLWNALSAFDWETLKSCLAEDVHYEDVPTEDPGARGPENTVKRAPDANDTERKSGPFNGPRHWKKV